LWVVLYCDMPPLLYQCATWHPLGYVCPDLPFLPPPRPALWAVQIRREKDKVLADVLPVKERKFVSVAVDEAFIKPIEDQLKEKNVRPPSPPT
jgi:hypothetical protein